MKISNTVRSLYNMDQISSGQAADSLTWRHVERITGAPKHPRLETEPRLQTVVDFFFQKSNVTDGIFKKISPFFDVCGS